MKKLFTKSMLVALLVSFCVPAMAQKYYNFNAVALDVDGLPQKIHESFITGNAGVVINPNSPDEIGTNYISDYIVKQGWGIVGVSQDFNFHEQLTSQFIPTESASAYCLVTGRTGSFGNSGDYAGIAFISSGNYSSSRLNVGQNQHIEITATANSGETLKMTKVKITCTNSSYRGGAYSVVADGATLSNATSSPNSQAYMEISIPNGCSSLKLTNGSSNNNMRIKSLEVTYTRTQATVYFATANPAGTNNENIVYGDSRVNNDGLCLVYPNLGDGKTYSVSGGTKVPWTTYAGNDENDDFVTRGYRMYTVAVATGVSVDVYVLDMDAGAGASDINARNAQISQLANAILGNTNGRPMVVLGTFNSLYTREKLEENFINKINNGGKDLIVKDVWVEFMRGGKYPTYGTDPELANTGYYDGQRGEAYNKVFFVNKTGANLTIKANSYERKEDFGQGDHKPILVNFTMTDASATSSSNNWTVEDGTVTTPEETVISGSKLASGTTYYIQNVSTGLYLKAGAQWGTQACEGSAGMPIKIVQSGSKFSLQTLVSGQSMSAEVLPFMDNGGNTTWTLQQVSGTSYQYYLKINDTQALSSIGDVNGVVKCVTFNGEDDKQKWVLLTENDIKTQMTNATPTKPFDVTPLVKAAGLDPMDIGSVVSTNTTYAQSNWGTTLQYYHEYTGNQPKHNGIAYYHESYYDDSDYFLGFIPIPNYSKTKDFKVTRSMTNMPAGIYMVSFEGYYNARALSSAWGAGVLGNRQYFPWYVKVSLGSDYAYVLQNVDEGASDVSVAAQAFRDNDNYKTTFECVNSASGTLNLVIDVPSFAEGESDRTVWFALDNFVIKYLGTESDNADAVKELVRNYINMTAQKVAQLNAAGQAAYDISEVIYRYNNNLLSSDGSIEIAMIDAAYEIALAAHNAQELEDNIEENNGDVTGAIVNPSFEYDNGSTYGWVQAPSIEWMDANCVAGGEENIDGSYRFNAWCAGPNVTPITQTVTGLKNGLYELKAMIASDAGNVVYLIGNDYHVGKVAEGANKFVETTLEFLVEDGTAKIGAVGGYQGHFYITGGWYKVDNFRLKYICDVAHGRVYLAHKEASAVYNTLDKFGKDYADGNAESYPEGETPLRTLLNTYKNANTTTIASLANSNGVNESAAIYSALTEAAFRQKTIGADMTWCFGDPSFEIGKYTQYWRMASGDTWGEFLAARQDDEDFAAVGVVGSYLLNVYDWNGTDVLTTTVGATNSIPNGIYELTAIVTSDNGCNVYIEANGEVSEPVTASDLTNADGTIVLPAGRRMFPIKHQFEVTDGTATIKVYAQNSEGEAHNFFKVDDFHLHIRLLASYQEPTEKYENNNTLYLDENSTEIPELPVLTKSVENTNFQYNRVEITRGISSGKWSTLVVPFDMPIGDLGDGNWDVRELTNAEVKTITADDGTEKEDVVISFTTPTDKVIQSGKCYIVRHETQSLSTVVMDAGEEVIAVNTTEFDKSFNTENNKLVEFVGTYTNGYVPAGSYFISNNLFKQAVKENTNKIKGFRAYFNVTTTSAGARGLSFRVGESTDIESTNNDEVTIVGIYNLSGMRLADMEPGVNILHMSDGSSVKVIIK